MSKKCKTAALCAVIFAVIAVTGCGHSETQSPAAPDTQANGAMKPGASAPGPRITPGMSPEQQQAAAEQTARAQQFQQLIKERSSQPQPK